MDWKKALIVGGLLTAAAGLYVYFKRQFQILYDSCYTITGGVVHSLGIDKVKISLFFKIVNKSDLTITVSNMNFNIYVNTMFVTNIKRVEPVTIYSKSEEIIKLDFEFNPKDLLKAGISNIQPILFDKEKLVITTKGTFTAETGIVKLNNFKFDEKITLKELLEPSPTPKKC